MNTPTQDQQSNLPTKKKSRRMKTFQVVSETIQFTVTAKGINSAFNKAARRLGQGHRIIVSDRDRTLTGMVPIES
jgi:hypothetical protein